MTIPATWPGVAIVLVVLAGRVAGLAFAAYLIHRGWEFWPIVIAIASLAS